MENQVIPISNIGLFFTLLLVAMAGAVAAVMQLGLLKSLIWASIRAVIQLSLIGYALIWIFSIDRPEVIIAVIGVMCFIAAKTAVRRTPNVRSFPTMLAFVSVVSSTYLVLWIVSALIIRADPWYTPRVTIPIAGMILGNTINGIALSLDRLYSEVRNRRNEVEALLALGATPRESIGDCLRQAVRAGMTPTINSLMVVGLVSIPGMMTGQILGGANPEEAARYQIVVMMMITAAAAFGSMTLVGLAYRRLFTEDKTLKTEILSGT